MMKEKQLEINNKNKNVKYNRTGQNEKQTVLKPKLIAAMTSKLSNTTISGQQRNNTEQPSSIAFKKPTVYVPATEGML